MSVKVVSFDGLNRCGKETQINLFANYLEKKGYAVRVMRGDGSRKGIGENGDQYCSWWQGMQISLRETDIHDNYYDAVWDKAARKLNQELYETYHEDFPKHIIDGGKEVGYILLDRSIISRFFVVRKRYPKVNIDDLIKFEYEGGNKRNVVLPELSFVIHVPKDELLRRNEVVSDHPDKYEFRKRIINNNYSDFEQTTKEFGPAGPESRLLNVYHINGDKTPNTVHNEIIQIYEKLGEIRANV